MKKIFLSILALSLFSCDVEQLDSSISTDDNGNGSNPTSGDYFPMALNNLWVSNNGSANTEMKMIATETLNNKTYFKTNSLFGTSDLGGPVTGKYYFRKADNKYYYTYEASINIAGVTMVTKLSDDQILLNDSLPVGGTWTQNLTTITTVEGDPETTTELLIINGKILDKLTNYTVGGTTYNDVIKVETKEVWGVGSDAITSTTTTYFAKGVGPIQSILVDEDNITTTTNLVSYSLN